MNTLVSLTLRFTLKILWKKNNAVSESNDPIPQDSYVMLGGITIKELRQIMSQTWDDVCDKSGLKRPKKTEI